MSNINFNSPYCNWVTVPFNGGRPNLKLFKDVKEVRAWLGRTDSQNAAKYGITTQTAMRVTRSLVPGGRTALNAHRLMGRQLGL